MCEPFLAAVARHPSEVKDFVRELVVEADRFSEEGSFWAVWQAFANPICAAPWIERLDSRYGSGRNWYVPSSSEDTGKRTYVIGVDLKARGIELTS